MKEYIICWQFHDLYDIIKNKGENVDLKLVVPQKEDLWFKKEIKEDPNTMSIMPDMI